MKVLCPEAYDKPGSALVPMCFKARVYGRSIAQDDACKFVHGRSVKLTFKPFFLFLFLGLIPLSIYPLPFRFRVKEAFA